jgi:uncharacterized protein YndB with AHSA1/START domain
MVIYNHYYMNAITIETVVRAPLEKVWEYWSNPEHVTKWAFASDDWEAPTAENDLRTGGKFSTLMAAKDKSAQFDFSGVYTAVKEKNLIEYDMDGDMRHVKIEFTETPEGIKITQTFDPEQENPIEMQREGWQAILNNFKTYVESN